MLTPSARKKPLALSCRGSAERFIAERSLSWAKKGKLATFQDQEYERRRCRISFHDKNALHSSRSNGRNRGDAILDRRNNYQVHHGPPT